MARNVPTAEQVQAEINSDPQGLGYNWATQTDKEIADKLNEKGASGETLIRDLVPIHEVLAALDLTEYAALTDAHRAMFTNVLLAKNESAELDLSLTELQTLLGSIFAPGTSRSNLIDLRNESVSRAVALWNDAYGRGLTIPSWLVGQARTLP
jgi:hypothetical protein